MVGNNHDFGGKRDFRNVVDYFLANLGCIGE